MTEQINDKVRRSMQSAAILYHRLVLLVGEPGSGKTKILQSVAKDCATSILNINLRLSSKLLELSPRQRILQVPLVLNQIVEQMPSPIVLDNLEILFDKNLQQDPLRLLQGLSRNQTVIASWNGSFDDRKLYYAESGHPEYRSYESVDTLIVKMNGKSTIDSTRNTSEAGQV